MAYDYAPLAATAQRLLALFGATVTLKKTTPGTYDPVTGETTGGTTATQTAAALLLPYKIGDQFADGSMVRTGDRRCVIEGKGLAWGPDVLTTLTDAKGVIWQLERVDPFEGNGVTATHYTANATR